MKIILDANILLRDPRMKGADFKVLLDGLSLVPIKLFVPQVVLDEVVNKARETFTEANDAITKHNRKLAQFVDDESRLSLVQFDIANEVLAYKIWLTETLHAIGVTFIPYPDVPHKEVVQRELLRRKPFKDNGIGYRDTLIWESVRRVTYSGVEPVIFVTANTRDFCTENGLHEDLKREVHSEAPFEILTSLSELNDRFVRPKLKQFEFIPGAISAPDGTNVALRTWLGAGLSSLVNSYDGIGQDILGWPQEAGSVRCNVVELHNASVTEARKMPSGQHLIRLTLELDIELDISVDWEDAYQYPEVREAVDIGEPFSSSSWGEIQRVNLQVDLILDSSNTVVAAEELRKLDSDNCSIEY